MSAKQHLLAAADGHRIRTFDWYPETSSPTPRAVIQILHGLGEHAARYEHFAATCTANEIAVVAHDHRGHGSVEPLIHFADEDGWDKVIADVLQVRQNIALRYPQVPVILLGHSMGSYIAQCFTMRHGGNNAALILSGSTLAARSELRMGRLAARFLSLVSGPRRVSKLLNGAGLGKFNRPFEPARTPFDWLSRDETAVDAYIADARCGASCTNRMWADLLTGLLEISTDESISLVREELPILILGGEEDPVGGKTGLTRLANAYRRTRHANLTFQLYPGGRHEMLNEINRDDVEKDVLGWILQVLAT